MWGYACHRCFSAGDSVLCFTVLVRIYSRLPHPVPELFVFGQRDDFVFIKSSSYLPPAGYSWGMLNTRTASQASWQSIKYTIHDDHQWPFLSRSSFSPSSSRVILSSDRVLLPASFLLCPATSTFVLYESLQLWWEHRHQSYRCSLPSRLGFLHHAQFLSVRLHLFAPASVPTVTISLLFLLVRYFILIITL